jgi:hypothetical protein
MYLCYSDICLEGPREEMKMPVIIIGNPAEIRTDHLPDTRQDCEWFGQLVRCHLLSLTGKANMTVSLYPYITLKIPS